MLVEDKAARIVLAVAIAASTVDVTLKAAMKVRLAVSDGDVVEVAASGLPTERKAVAVVVPVTLALFPVIRAIVAAAVLVTLAALPVLRSNTATTVDVKARDDGRVAGAARVAAVELVTAALLAADFVSVFVVVLISDASLPTVRAMLFVVVLVTLPTLPAVLAMPGVVVLVTSIDLLVVDPAAAGRIAITPANQSSEAEMVKALGSSVAVVLLRRQYPSEAPLDPPETWLPVFV